MTVKSKPKGAEVYVDGKKLGETPLRFTLLRAADDAERTVTLRMKGYRDHEEKFRPNGDPIEMSTSLQAESPT